MDKNFIYLDNNKNVLKQLHTESIDLIYIDPPFNTKRTQKMGGMKYDDSYINWSDMMEELLWESHRLLKHTGSIYVHIDYRTSVVTRILLDKIFKPENFKNEIIWAYDYGGRSKKYWPRKHDTIYFYIKSNEYIFNYEEIERIPYMAPSLVGKEKANRGKVPTDVWWHTIVGTQSKERTGYPTQKPVNLIKRIIQASSPENGLVLDFFAGSGTTAQAAYELNRNFIIIDNNYQTLQIYKKRFKNYKNTVWCINKQSCVNIK